MVCLDGERSAGGSSPDCSFTGANEDTVSTGSYPLCDFPMREYHPTWGRWLTPDPAGLKAVKPDDPQTWNLYAYVRNNPTTNTDPDGEDYYLVGGAACLNVPDPCDNQGYLLDENGSRQVITDQQVLNGEVGVTWGANGTASTITTDQGTFEVQFFDNLPTSIDVNSAPGSALAGVGINFGIGLYNTAADTASSFIRNLTFGQYSLNLPYVQGGLSDAAAAGQFLAMVIPAVVPGGEEETAEQIIASSKKGSILREFPSQFLDKTLKEIKLARQEGVPFAAKAWKLLTDSRFNK